MAPNLSASTRRSVKKPLIQPALPLLPSLRSNRPAQSITPPTSDHAHNEEVSSLPEPAPVTAESPQNLDNFHPEPSNNAPEPLVEAPESTVTEPADATLNGIETLPDTVTETASKSQTDVQELPATALDEVTTPVDAKVNHELIGDDPTSVASYSHSVTRNNSSPGAVNHASESASNDDVQEDNRIDDHEDVRVPTRSLSDTDGKLPTPANVSQDFTQHDRVDDSNTATSGSDEGYGSRDYTGATSATSPQPTLLNGTTQNPLVGMLQAPMLIGLSDHLLQLANTKAWADFALLINTKDPQPVMCYAHSMVLIRSPRLRKLMERPATTPTNTLALAAPASLLPHAFEAALRFLYSDAVLTAEALLPQHGRPETYQARPAILQYILSYWLSGLLLGIDHIVSRASSLLTELIDWDVVEILVKEAETLAAGIDTAVLESDINWSDVAIQWKTAALGFCAASTNPQTLNIDASSTSLLHSRFGALEEGRSKHNPALASMVFGSMPPSADMSPISPQVETIPPLSSTPHTVLSNILLNAEFQDLVYFQQQLQRVWGASGHRFLADIIGERETRRLKLLHNQAVPNKVRIANSTVWSVVGFREAVQDGKVTRERVGFLQSSGR